MKRIVRLMLVVVVNVGLLCAVRALAQPIGQGVQVGC